MEEHGTVRISQCMIVKNEEANIQKALSWGREIVWEQIVVDTGSTDRTVELAEAMGARIYHFPWIDDFAAAKNFAISKCGGDWIAFLDADEVFAPGDERKLLTLLEQLHPTQADAVNTGLSQVDSQGNVSGAGSQIRVFRNRPGVGYIRRIHEQLAYMDGTTMRVADASQDIFILHSGYSGKIWEEKKVSRRNIDLISKELEDHPESYEMMGYMGDEYYSAGNSEDAEPWYRKSIASLPPAVHERDQRTAVTFIYLMEIVGRGDCEEGEMLDIYQKAVSYLPREADFDYNLGCYYMDRNDFSKGAHYLEQALHKLEQYGCYNRAMKLVGNLEKCYENIALCYYRTGEPEKAVTWCAAVLKTNHYNMMTLCMLLKAFQGNSLSFPLKETIGFLQKLYDFNRLKDRLFLLRSSEEADCRELKDYLERFFTKEELEHIRKVLGKEG